MLHDSLEIGSRPTDWEPLMYMVLSLLLTPCEVGVDGPRHLESLVADVNSKLDLPGLSSTSEPLHYPGPYETAELTLRCWQPFLNH